MDALVAVTSPGTTELLAILILMAVMAAAAVLVVIWFARKTLENKRENVKLRLEVGKLAEELEQVRKQRRSA